MPEAQRSIQNLIEFFQKERAIQLVTLEGVSGELDLHLLRSFPDPKLLKKTLDEFLDRGELSGVTTAAFLSKTEAHYFGVEERSLYEAQIDALLNALRFRPSIQRELERETSALETLKQKTYSPELLEFDRPWDDFEKGGADFMDLLHSLIPHTAQFEGFSSRFPHLSLIFRSLTEKQQALDQEAFSGLDPPKLKRELEEFRGDLKEKLFRNPEERKIDQTQQGLRLTEKLIDFSLTRQEWNEFKIKNEALEPFRDFYKIARQREGMFLNNLFRIMEEQKAQDALLVVGGFHTTALTEQFKKRGISYALVSPKIGGLPKESDYLRQMQGEVSWKSYLKIEGDRVDVYDAFHRAVLDRLIDPLLARSPDGVPHLLIEWRRRLFQRLADQHELDQAFRYTPYLETAASKLVPASELSSVKKAWLDRADRFIAGLRHLHAEGRLTADSVSRLASEMTAQLFLANPAVSSKDSVPARWLASSARSEVRNTDPVPPRVNRWVTELRPAIEKALGHHTLVFRQMEAGLHRGVQKKLREKFGPKTANYINQAQMTGGLGALMRDLFEAIKRNLFGVASEMLAILPVYEQVKGQAQGLVVPGDQEESFRKEFFGDKLQEVLDPTGISFTFRVPMSDTLRQLANRAGGKYAAVALNPIKVEVFYTETEYAKTPIYYYRAYYQDDQGQWHPIYEELYPDELVNDIKLWRTFQTAIYREVTERLLPMLREQGKVREKIFYVDNELYPSLPTKESPDSLRMHINHTVVKAADFSPPESAFEMLRFPERLRSYLVRNGWIILTNFVAFTYHVITGVALFIHLPVLDQFFGAALHRLKGKKEDHLRSTNGVFLEHWQSDHRRTLIHQYKTELGLDPQADDEELYRLLQNPENGKWLDEFKRQNEFVAASDVAFALVWLAEKQGQPRWLIDTHEKHLKLANRPSSVEKDLNTRIAEAKSAMLSLASAVGDAVSKGLSWEQVFRDHETLKEAIMLDPMVVNVRRQVDYKGFRKLEEILSDLEKLKGDPSKIEEYRTTHSRVLIGGRTFDRGAYDRFRRIKTLIETLGLQDRFATIENYSIDEEAPLLFKAAAGTSMQSNRKKEAAATSQSKGYTNFAVILSVFDGASPELFRIVEKATGLEIDIFERKITYEELVEKLHRGEWEITNGWLVEYGPPEWSDGEWVETPNKTSLLKGLAWLQSRYQEPASRRDLQFEALRTSPKVDMERGQARALLLLMKDAIEGKTATEELLAPLAALSTTEILQLLEKPPSFFWKRTEQEVIPLHLRGDASGLLGFIESWRRLRAQGNLAYDAVKFHANQNEMGNIFHYFLTGILGNGNGEILNPIKERIEELSRKAQKAKKSALQETNERRRQEYEREVLVYNFEALDLFEKVTVRLSWQLLRKYYVDRDPTAAEKIGHPRIKENLLQYLEKYAMPLSSNNQDIELFVLESRPGTKEALMVALNMGEFKDPGQQRGRQNTTNPSGRDALEKLFGKPPLDVFQVYQLTQINPVGDDRNLGLFTTPEIVNDNIRLEVTHPDVQVYRLSPPSSTESPKLAFYLSHAVNQAPLEGGRPASELVRNELIRLSSDPSRLLNTMTVVANTAKADIEGGIFGQEGIAPVMALVSFLDPELLPRMAGWDPAAYQLLNSVINHPDVHRILKEGELHIHTTSLDTAVVLSKTLGQKTIVLPLHFNSIPSDSGDGKIRLRITDLKPLGIEPDKTYVAFDYTVGAYLFDEPQGRYPGDLRGSDLLANGWGIGIPARRHKVDYHGIAQHGLLFQFLKLQELPPPPATPRSEMRKERLATEQLFSLISGREEREALTNWATHSLRDLDISEVLKLAEEVALEAAQFFAPIQHLEQDPPGRNRSQPVHSDRFSEGTAAAGVFQEYYLTMA